MAIGRPKKYALGREEEVGFLQGRCSQALFDYLRMLAVHPRFPYRNLAGMYGVLFDKFLEAKPWELGLVWRKPRSIKSISGGTGFVQVNIQVPKELEQRVRDAAAAQDVSLAVFIYTALYWWGRYVHPPKKG